MPERRVQYRVTDAQGSVATTFAVLRLAKQFVARANAGRVPTLRHYEPPFRVQSRVVTVGDWKDET